MKNLIKILFLVLLCLIFSKTALAQKKTWEDTITEVNTLYQQNNITQAIEVAKKALDLAKNEFGPDTKETAITINTLAYLYFKQTRYAEAEKLCKQAIEIVEKISPEGEETAAALNNLAEIYVAEKKYSDAELLYKRSLAIVEKALGPDDPYVGMILESISELYKAMGRLEEAKTTLERAQQIAEKENIQ